MNDLLSNPYGFLMVCVFGGWLAVVCAFLMTDVMCKLFPPSPAHVARKGCATRMTDDELRKRLYK